MLFGIPDHKDEMRQRRVCRGRHRSEGLPQGEGPVCPELYLIGDVCMCEYTSHGHCGILHGHDVDNDKTLDYAGEDRTVSGTGGRGHGRAVGHDGRTRRLRSATMLDQQRLHEHAHHGLLRRSLPRRSTARSATRRTRRRRSATAEAYQMDSHNRREALQARRCSDVDEGADILMVKPAMAYGDLIRETRDGDYDLPVAAYSVSGEYSMVKTTAAS